MSTGTLNSTPQTNQNLVNENQKENPREDSLMGV